jgi:thiol-disulfide isomerase/thioredoxin
MAFSFCLLQAVPKSVLAGALALVFAFPGAFVLGQAPQPKTKASSSAKPADPKARALLDEVSRSYKALGSYSDQGQFVVAMNIAGKEQKQVLPLKLTFVRPNKLDLDAGPVRVVSDGKTITTAIIPLKRYTNASAPEQINFETFRQGPTGAVLFGGPTGPPMFVLLNLLTAPDAAAALDQLGGSLQIAPPDPKSTAAAILIDQTDGPDIRLKIDPSSKLLSSIDFLIDAKTLAQSVPAGQKISVEEFGWTAGSVKMQVGKDQLFAYEPPKGFTKVDTLLERPAKEEAPKSAVQEKVGRQSPGFTLTVLDGPGKTRTVTRDELAGKVVVIDFWATWCDPCLRELPEIQKLVDALVKDKKNVVLVALSQDSEPSELGEVRKLVEKTLSAKEIKLDGNAVGLIGLDPSGSVGRAFDVGGFPTIVVLDVKGNVKSAHVGFSPDIRETLTSEIDSLLAGKPLATEKPKEAVRKLSVGADGK